MMMKNEHDAYDTPFERRNENEKFQLRKRLIGSVVLMILIVAVVTGFHHQASSSASRSSNLVLKKENGHVSGDHENLIRVPHGVTSDVFGGITVSNAGLGYPYMVMIYRSTDNNIPICGGVLFKWNFVLTAAHCLQRFDGRRGYQPLASFRVRAGLRHLDQANWGAHVQTRRVNFIIKHESYLWNAAGVDMDIGIMRLETPFPNTTRNHIDVAPLASSSRDYPAVDTTVEMVGTGPHGVNAAGVKQWPDVLKRGVAKTMSLEDCRRVYPTALADRDFCFWDDPADRYGICVGDSGSPVIDTSVAPHKVIGITIQGSSTCTHAGVGVASFIPRYEQWIRTTRTQITQGIARGGLPSWV